MQWSLRLPPQNDVGFWSRNSTTLIYYGVYIMIFLTTAMSVYKTLFFRAWSIWLSFFRDLFEILLIDLVAREQRLVIAFILNPSIVQDQATVSPQSVSYTHLRAHETRHDLVCRLLLEKKQGKRPVWLREALE